MAQWFIRNKIISYSLSFAALADGFTVNPAHRDTFFAQHSRAEKQLKTTRNVPQVMGVEGQLAQSWFDLLSRTLPAELHFQGRNRRPPHDPVNSLLSLGYTMLFSEVRQALLIQGFDPSLGFLHQDYPGREALVLDFMEIFRSGVDTFVLGWISETKLDSSSFFYRKQDGCRLSKSIRPLFFQAWAQQRANWPRFDGKGESDQNAPIRELLLGQTVRARKQMIELEDKYVTNIPADPGNQPH